MITKTEFAEILNSQRYLMVALAYSFDEEISEEVVATISENINSLWASTEFLAGEFGLELSTKGEIIKHGKDMVELERMHSL